MNNKFTKLIAIVSLTVASASSMAYMGEYFYTCTDTNDGSYQVGNTSDETLLGALKASCEKSGGKFTMQDISESTY